MNICRFGATIGIGKDHYPEQTRTMTRVVEILADLPEVAVARIIN